MKYEQDDWVICPYCGSEDAHIMYDGDRRRRVQWEKFQCPDCTAEEIISREEAVDKHGP